MPNYTKIPDSFRKSYKVKFTKEYSDEDLQSLCPQDPVLFALYHLGKKVRLHQAYLIHRILTAKNKRIAACFARQLGKSIGLAIFLIWAAWYNKFPATINNITAIYLISRDDDASVELLDKIRQMLYNADKHMETYTDTTDYFSSSLKEPNNTHQLTFLNNSFIKSIPPTGKVLGKSASIVVIDEAHRLKCDNPDDFFNMFVVPTTAETGGYIILSSSPEGIVGFFYDAIDPENKKSDNTYESLWFNWQIWDDGSQESLNYKKFVLSEKERLSSEGKLKVWQQEYDALFTVTQTSFFEFKDIDESLKDTAMEYEWHKTPVSIAYDYGMRISRTVITARTEINGELIQLWQYRCPAGFDINLLQDPTWEHSYQKLKKRYNITHVIGDDCPQGNSFNMWLESNANVNVKKYNFRSDQMSKTDGLNRNCVAYSYRAKLKSGQLKIPTWNKTQQSEMKIIQETEQKVLISIKAPAGHLCDTFDSDMMACIPFLDMETSGDFNYDPVIHTSLSPSSNNSNGRYDGFHSPTVDEMQKSIKDQDISNIGYYE